MSKPGACDDSLISQVRATHALQVREVAVDPLISITDEILIQAITCSTGDVHERGERPETSTKASELDTNDTLIIQKISRELSSYKRRYFHGKTMELLVTLSSYHWHAKVALVLTGFAINFGEFSYYVQPSPANTLSKSVALLGKLPNVGDKSFFLKLDMIYDLVKVILDVAKSMAEVMNILQFYYISEDQYTEFSLIPNAAYWTIRSILTCSSQIASFMNWKNEYISPRTEASELTTLASTVKSIHGQLNKQLDRCYKKIGLGIIHVSLTNSDEDDQTHIIGSSEKRTGMEIQKKKHVLLLMSDLNISKEEIQVLGNLYKEQAMKSERLYEMVWIPLVDKRSSSRSNDRKFGELKSMMPWHSIHYSVINPALMKQIKNKLTSNEKPIVLVRDPHGMVTSINAVPMIWIWGNLAFPFTFEREKELWSTQVWSLRTIIEPIDATILEWISEDNHICLYGGANLEWIRTFTKTMTSVARAANIKLKMAYMGERNSKEETQKMTAAIDEEKLSYVLPNYTSFWLFWEKLESIRDSKSEHLKTVENNECVNDVTTLLFDDCDKEEWAMIFRGEADRITGDNGPNILEALEMFKYWEADVEPNGFETALQKYLEGISIPRCCTRLILPCVETSEGYGGRCGGCDSKMFKHVAFSCSKD